MDAQPCGTNGYRYALRTRLCHAALRAPADHAKTHRFRSATKSLNLDSRTRKSLTHPIPIIHINHNVDRNERKQGRQVRRWPQCHRRRRCSRVHDPSTQACMFSLMKFTDGRDRNGPALDGRLRRELCLGSRRHFQEEGSSRYQGDQGIR